ncbi:UDP-2,4-diacetamido-2,4,6-trideoxy-beta-L-altropyranose hydrolase [Bradyrhizobium japonicum]|uniref:UDP-2,4-diacetamido-2,4, 6-trideoxy-beta-L-altropyranose hydrolase n=1 Tax=Bradyrhizobium japonicum TaxID=375 RepID=A0A1Y2JA02_BRAJP|nr:UDP-2,4-diacetamido-2,4,6-trideoxy-beta-L-altropyranose hydrolase [Bradyrhizobium japonicum]OSJ21471.1 UDP-2,4-diacetamido-2,4,6-trideoxy-beta-L-altropyranose hydrolase [Bradyrhizobium japonicum]
MNKQVVFRVDASVEMGLGHLTRCLTLADALASGGARSCFLMRSHAAGLAHLVESHGHAVRLLSDPSKRPETDDRGGPHRHWLPTTWQQDADQTRIALDEIGPAEWLVVDHYALDARWEHACRREGTRILAIDDLADRAHDCEILLDQNLVSHMETRYRDRVPFACVQLLGPGYALLRPEFAAQRRLLAQRDGNIGRILICFGGSDPTNETAKALTAIARLAHPSLAVDAVIGLSNPHADSVAQLCHGLSGTELHRGANNIAELMRRADLSIGAGGVMSWERCCLGLPVIAVDIASNQVGALEALAAEHAAVYLGAASDVSGTALADAIRALLDDAARTRALGEAALALVDGQGADRVVACMRATSG